MNYYGRWRMMIRFTSDTIHAQALPELIVTKPPEADDA